MLSILTKIRLSLYLIVKLSHTCRTTLIKAAGDISTFQHFNISTSAFSVWVCDETREFKCARTGKCITLEQRCDGTLNCGDFDDSDETECGESHILRILFQSLYFRVIPLLLLYVCVGIILGPDIGLYRVIVSSK